MSRRLVVVFNVWFRPLCLRQDGNSSCLMESASQKFVTHVMFVVCIYVVIAFVMCMIILEAGSLLNLSL